MTRTDSLCEQCGRRPATMAWVGDGGVLAMAHGCGALWCEHCVVTAQLVYAHARAVAIPELERRLAELEDSA